MRQYQAIWDRIKRNNTASIVAPVHKHPRIIKAVAKEKYMDDGYKLQLAEVCLVAILHTTIDPTNKELLTFSLTKKIKETYIGASSL